MMMSDRWSLWTRNVIDRYKNWSTESIRKDLQRTANPFGVCMEHWQGDFNISTLIRNANAFNAKKVYYLGKKKYDRRGTVGTHHYIDLDYLGISYNSLVELKNEYTIVAIDNNVPNTHKLGEFDWNMLEKPPLMVFGEEGVGLTSEVLKIAKKIASKSSEAPPARGSVGNQTPPPDFDKMSKGEMKKNWGNILKHYTKN